MDEYRIQDWNTHHDIVFRSEGKPIVTIKPNGNVELDPSTDVNEASRLFWDSVSTYIGKASFLKVLRAASTSRRDDWHHDMKWNVMEWGCAMAGEAGEACNVAKKIRRVQQGIQKRKEEGLPASLDILRAKLAEEIADTIIYLDLMAADQGIDLEEAVRKKFNQVSEEFGFPQRI